MQRQVGDVHGVRRRRAQPVGGVAARRRLGLDRVAAELVAQRGDRLHRRAVVLAGDEPGEQRGGDRRASARRCRCRPRRSSGPRRSPRRSRAILSRSGVLVERGDQQVEQPGPDHGALAPGAEDLGDVVDQVDRLEQLPALGVGLHDGVLDAVVDHLGEVPGADLAGVHEAELALGLERVEDRLHLRDVARRRRRPSARSRSPGPRRRRRRRSRRSRCPCSPSSSALRLVVGPAGVAAVDDDVALAEQLAERRRRSARVGSPAGTITQTTLGAGSCSTMLLEAVDVADVRVAVVADDGVPGAAQPLAHVAAHLAEPDESELHAVASRSDDAWSRRAPATRDAALAQPRAGARGISR